MKIIRKFFCDKCGLCCKAIDKTFDRGDGYCKYLTPENTCSIYEDRPDLCRVDKVYDIFYKDKLTKEEYYKRTKDGCRKLKQQ